MNESAAALSVGLEDVCIRSPGEGAQDHGGQVETALPLGPEVKYIIIDTETSGLPDYKLPAEHPSQPRLAELVIIPCNEYFQPQQPEEFLIYPDGWEMEPGAIAVTGITTELLQMKGIPVREALLRYVELIDAGAIVVAHNSQFDTKIMRGELRRLGIDDRFHVTKTICTMRAMTEVCQLMPKGNRPGYKWPTLAEAYKHISGAARVGLAHSALNDARDTVTLAHWMLTHNKLPEPKVYLKGGAE
jgi:DNA polymerase-3 subunit epsilon